MNEITCSCCGGHLHGAYFVQNDGYYCSDDCRRSSISDEEYEEMCQYGQAYWTETVDVQGMYEDMSLENTEDE